MGQVGDVEQVFLLTLRGDFHLGIDGIDFRIDGAGFSLGGGGILALALGHADLFGELLALGLQGLFFRLGGTALFIAGQHIIDEFPVIAATEFEAILNGGRIFADDSNVEHEGDELSVAEDFGIRGALAGARPHPAGNPEEGAAGLVGSSRGGTQDWARLWGH